MTVIDQAEATVIRDVNRTDDYKSWSLYGRTVRRTLVLKCTVARK